MHWRGGPFLLVQARPNIELMRTTSKAALNPEDACRLTFEVIDNPLDQQSWPRCIGTLRVPSSSSPPGDDGWICLDNTSAPEKKCPADCLSEPFQREVKRLLEKRLLVFVQMEKARRQHVEHKPRILTRNPCFAYHHH